jgi:hypothetical protein
MGTARWSAVRPVAGAQVVGGPRVLPHRRTDEQVLSRECREEEGSTKLSREDKDGGAGSSFNDLKLAAACSSPSFPCRTGGFPIAFSQSRSSQYR